ncbi:MAG: hypothetical protein HY320_12210 [Armatimonadetes bacterium]|nr:hypothetical protein [Armatimonadota bacterium]
MFPMWAVCLALLAWTPHAQIAAAEASVMSSTQLSIRFSPDTGGISGISTVAGRHEFIRRAADRPLLWRLIFHDQTGKEVGIDNAHAAPPVIETTARGRSLRWNRVDLPGESGALDVRVTCQLKPGADTALLRLWVRHRSKAFGLWSVHFPLISPLAEPGSADIAIGRGNWGELYEKAQESISGNYPSHNMPMQLMLLHEGQDGLYLAAHDPQARAKVFELHPGGEFRVHTWAEDMGIPGNNWTAPYPFALGVYRGNWMVGCKRYRAWALKEAPWTQRGPLTQRADVPEAIKKVTAWVLGDGPGETVVPAVRRFAQAIGAPVGVHWYNWHEIPFDTDYPAYFPARPRFAEAVAEMKREDVVVMPYINARLWDSANKDFPQARPFSVKDEQGNPVIEVYGSGAKLVVMCPTQPFWQEKVFEIVRRLGEEGGVNAVYLDQIASAGPRLCFDRSHRHPLGSGGWWADGYRDMLNPIREWSTSHGRQISLTTENDAEPYMDNINGFLIWTPREEREIPMTTAVYSGYTLYFASNHALSSGDESYCLLQARDFVWGTQLGWEGTAILEPEHAAKLEYLSRLARMRSPAVDYLVYGELLDVLRPENDIPDLTGTWDTWKGNQPVRLKAVHAALWRGRNGSAAVLLANADTRPHPYTFVFDADRYGLGRASRWRLSQISLAGTRDLPAQSGRRFSWTAEVPGREALMIVLRPQRSR